MDPLQRLPMFLAAADNWGQSGTVEQGWKEDGELDPVIAKQLSRSRGWWL